MLDIDIKPDFSAGTPPPESPLARDTKAREKARRKAARAAARENHAAGDTSGSGMETLAVFEGVQPRAVPPTPPAPEPEVTASETLKDDIRAMMEETLQSTVKAALKETLPDLLRELMAEYVHNEAHKDALSDVVTRGVERAIKENGGSSALLLRDSTEEPAEADDNNTDSQNVAESSKRPHCEQHYETREQENETQDTPSSPRPAAQTNGVVQARFRDEVGKQWKAIAEGALLRENIVMMAARASPEMVLYSKLMDKPLNHKNPLLAVGRFIEVYGNEYSPPPQHIIECLQNAKASKKGEKKATPDARFLQLVEQWRLVPWQYDLLVAPNEEEANNFKACVALAYIEAVGAEVAFADLPMMKDHKVTNIITNLLHDCRKCERNVRSSPTARGEDAAVVV